MGINDLRAYVQEPRHFASVILHKKQLKLAYNTSAAFLVVFYYVKILTYTLSLISQVLKYVLILSERNSHFISSATSGSFFPNL
jgi:hypothetical protein